MEMQDVRALACQPLNLFDVDLGTMTKGGLDCKPRAANADEVRAYCQWLARRAGLFPFEHVDCHSQRDHRGRTIVQCTRATFGRQIKAAHWEGNERIEAEYEAGSYSVMVPHIAQPIVTMETLDAAGEVIASQTLPVDPKKHGVIWDAKAVRAVAGPIAKPAKRKRAKASPPAMENVTAPPSVAMHEEPDQAELIASLVARIETLERLVSVPSIQGEKIIILPAHANDDAPAPTPAVAMDRARRGRIVRAYLRMRRERALDRAALHAGREYCQQLQDRAEKAEARTRGLEMRIEDAEFRASDLQTQLVEMTTRAETAEAANAPALDKATARIVQLERELQKLRPPAPFNIVGLMTGHIDPVRRNVMVPA